MFFYMTIWGWLNVWRDHISVHALLHDTCTISIHRQWCNEFQMFTPIIFAQLFFRSYALQEGVHHCTLNFPYAYEFLSYSVSVCALPSHTCLDLCFASCLINRKSPTSMSFRERCAYVLNKYGLTERRFCAMISSAMSWAFKITHHLLKFWQCDFPEAHTVDSNIILINQVRWQMCTKLEISPRSSSSINLSGWLQFAIHQQQILQY